MPRTDGELRSVILAREIQHSAAYYWSALWALLPGTGFARGLFLHLKNTREDLVDIRRGEGADARLLAASPWRAHDIAGDPDDAVLLAIR